MAGKQSGDQIGRLRRIHDAAPLADLAARGGLHRKFRRPQHDESTVNESSKECKKNFVYNFIVRCIRCKWPWHPATGDYDRAHDVATCGACARQFYSWLRGHVRRQWGGQDFYEAAATSIRAR